MATAFPYRLRLNNVLIRLENRDITEKQADVLVTWVNRKLRLHQSGALGQALEKEGGPSIQQELQACLKNRGSSEVPDGTLLQTKAGRLPASFIYHVVWSRASDAHAEQTYKDAITNCLKTAWDCGFKTIALTSFGSRNFGDARIAVMQMEEIRNFASTDEVAMGRGTGTMTVDIVVRGKCFQEFAKLFDELDGKS